MMKPLFMAAALVALLSAPAFAQTGESLAQATTHAKHRASAHHQRQPASAFGTVTPFGSPTAQPMTPARDAAIRDCNAASGKTYPTRDSNWPFEMYRACMAEHGQPE